MASTFVVAYSEGNDAQIGLRYVRWFNSWLALEGSAAFMSPVWRVQAAGFSDSTTPALRSGARRGGVSAAQPSGGRNSYPFEELNTLKVNTRVLSGRFLLSPPARGGELRAFVTMGLTGLWHEGSPVLGVQSPNGARLSALSLDTRVAANVAAGFQWGFLQGIGLRVEGDVWLSRLGDRIGGEGATVRNLAILGSIAALF